MHACVWMHLYATKRHSTRKKNQHTRLRLTENVLESMHEAFARGVKMGGGGAGAREQPQTTVPIEQEAEMEATKPGVPGAPGVVIQEEVRDETLW